MHWVLAAASLAGILGTIFLWLSSGAALDALWLSNHSEHEGAVSQSMQISWWWKEIREYQAEHWQTELHRNLTHRERDILRRQVVNAVFGMIGSAFAFIAAVIAFITFLAG